MRGGGGNGDRDIGSEVQDHLRYKESFGSSLGYVRLFQNKETKTEPNIIDTMCSASSVNCTHE